MATRWAYQNFSCMIEDVIENTEVLTASCEEGPGDQVVTEEDKHGH